MLNFSQNLSFQGLGTLTWVCPETSAYQLSGKISLPELTPGSSAPSSCLVTINVNGTPKYTGQAGAQGFACTLSLTLADSVTIVFSSAAAVDQFPNVIKSVISISEGIS